MEGDMRQVLGLAIVACMAASTAHAADPAGPARARAAQCVVSAEREATLGLLAIVPTSVDDRDAGADIVHRARGCDRKLLHEPNNGDVLVEMRGLLAEQLLVGKPFPDPLPGRGTRRFAAIDLNEIERLGANRATLVFYDTAACAMDRNWDGARALLGAPHGSDAERHALRALEPDFAACLNGVRSMAIPPLFARAAIAEEVWARLNPTALRRGNRNLIQ